MGNGLKFPTFSTFGHCSEGIEALSRPACVWGALGAEERFYAKNGEFEQRCSLHYFASCIFVILYKRKKLCSKILKRCTFK